MQTQFNANQNQLSLSAQVHLNAPSISTATHGSPAKSSESPRLNANLIFAQVQSLWAHASGQSSAEHELSQPEASLISAAELGHPQARLVLANRLSGLEQTKISSPSQVNLPSALTWYKKAVISQEARHDIQINKASSPEASLTNERKYEMYQLRLKRLETQLNASRPISPLSGWKASDQEVLVFRERMSNPHNSIRDRTEACTTLTKNYIKHNMYAEAIQCYHDFLQTMPGPFEWEPGYIPPASQP